MNAVRFNHIQNTNQNIQFKGQISKNMANETEIKNTLKNLLVKSEREYFMPPTGDFEPIEESFFNKDNSHLAGKITLKITPDSDDPMSRMLNIIVKTKSGKGEIRELIELGTNPEIIKVLKNPEMPEQLSEYIKSLDTDLEKLR